MIKDNNGDLTPLPGDAFASVGASINTVLLFLPSGEDGGTLRTHAWYRHRRGLQMQLFAA
ncbi:hypothetical protein [Planotetraspora sp. GP83]|uniref:hypothetical protein n=1 Tax=Planotetraspora sp. GP83 TaxID=3156264 RepID=UPI003518E250